MTHFWTRVGMIGMASCAMAACATSHYPVAEGQAKREPLEMPKANFPVMGEETAPVATAQTTARATTTTVQTGTLAPAAPPTAVSSQPLAPISQPQVTPTPQPVTKTVTVAGGKVVDAEGRPTTYEVQPGDTLYSISRKLGTTVSKLSDDNGIDKPSSLQPGRTLKGPAPRAKAYVVQSGDTLFAIARRFSVPAGSLAETNDFAVATPIRPGQRLLLPSGYKDAGPSTRTVTVTPPAPVYQRPVQVAAQTQPAPVVTTTTTTTTTPPAVVTTPPATPAYTPPVTTPPVARPYTPPVTTAKPYTPPVVARPYTPPVTTARPYAPPATSGNPIVQTNAPPTDAEVAAAGQGRFVWPLMGEVIAGYGPKGGGQRNDGLNIRALPGTQVRAAANGEVVYAGDQVPGFGNLVLVKHNGGWVTAYAHLNRIDVKMRDAVMQGQQLGAVGSTGGVGEPQLHFEVRYAPSPKDKARPVDPALVLPRS